MGPQALLQFCELCTYRRDVSESAYGGQKTEKFAVVTPFETMHKGHRVEGAPGDAIGALNNGVESALEFGASVGIVSAERRSRAR